MKNRFAIKIIISVVIFSLVFCLGLLIMGDTAEASMHRTAFGNGPAIFDGLDAVARDACIDSIRLSA